MTGLSLYPPRQMLAGDLPRWVFPGHPSEVRHVVGSVFCPPLVGVGLWWQSPLRPWGFRWGVWGNPVAEVWEPGDPHPAGGPVSERPAGMAQTLRKSQSSKPTLQSPDWARGPSAEICFSRAARWAGRRRDPLISPPPQPGPCLHRRPSHNINSVLAGQPNDVPTADKQPKP